MKVLVTGGCGYIGSHTIVDLLQHGYDVISVDNYVRSDPDVLTHIETITGRLVPNYDIDLKDEDALRYVFEANRDIQAVIHFAAYKAVGESVAEPLLYYKNNLQSLMNVLTCVDVYKVPYVVFSSSCTVYGEPDVACVTETTPLNPAASPYGSTKQMGEIMLRDFAAASSTTKVTMLRYFNPAGAHPSLRIGERGTHGIQSLTSAIVAAVRSKQPVRVFGGDYATADGSCMRDFVHVCDIAAAHTCALTYMINKQTVPSRVFNLGMGTPHTVLEAIRAFEAANSRTVDYVIVDRRPGDVEAIYSDIQRAKDELEWVPKYTLHDIMKTAWMYTG
jgi:UDP-glucose 4-epimerase